MLAQLGSRIQHQLRAHTPDAAKALRATVSTYPMSGYDLEEVLTQLATGEAIVTVMSERGAPTPVAWTRLRAPQGSMDPSTGRRHRCRHRRITAAGEVRNGARPRIRPRDSGQESLTRPLKRRKQPAPDVNEQYERMRRDGEKPRPSQASPKRRPAEKVANPITDFLGSRQGKAIVNSVVKGIFGTLRRR